MNAYVRPGERLASGSEPACLERVMVVGDAPPGIGAIRRALPLSGGGAVEAHGSPEAALTALEARGRSAARVVMAKLHLSGTDGVSFLEQVRERAPAATRILLCGRGEGHPAVGEDGSGLIHDCLVEPLDDDRLALALKYGLVRARLQSLVDARTAMLTATTRELELIRRLVAEIFV